MPSDLDTIGSQSSISASALGDLFDPGYRETRFHIAHILSQGSLLGKSRRQHLNHAQQLRLSLRIFKRLLQLRDAHAWITQVLAKSDDTATAGRIRSEVRALCEQFPAPTA